MIPSEEAFHTYVDGAFEVLNSRGIGISPGLRANEFARIEAEFGFQFPPDLRQLVAFGLPVGAGFPDWRDATSDALWQLI